MLGPLLVHNVTAWKACWTIWAVLNLPSEWMSLLAGLSKPVLNSLP